MFARIRRDRNVVKLCKCFSAEGHTSSRSPRRPWPLDTSQTTLLGTGKLEELGGVARSLVAVHLNLSRRTSFRLTWTNEDYQQSFASQKTSSRELTAITGKNDTSPRSRLHAKLSGADVGLGGVNRALGTQGRIADRRAVLPDETRLVGRLKSGSRRAGIVQRWPRASRTGPFPVPIDREDSDPGTQLAWPPAVQAQGATVASGRQGLTRLPDQSNCIWRVITRPASSRENC